MVKRKNFATWFKKVDFFATDVGFRENGGDKFGSVFGACTSLLIALIVASYCFNKFLIMLNH